MAARPVAPAPNMEQFEAYFQRADLDKDGRISGPEAVAFFQGSNLPKNILAQIWMHSDKNNTSFLGRAEFYNALKLVTVAQSGRELTKEIIKAALEGPAAAKIPPPQINPVATPMPPVNPMFAPRPQLNTMMHSSALMGSIPPASTQNLGFRGPQTQVLPNMGMNQQSFPSSGNQFMQPTLQTTLPPSSLPLQSGSQGLPGGTMSGPHLPSSNAPNLSTDWFGARPGGTTGGITQIPNRGITPSSQDGFASAFSGPGNLATQRPQATSVQSALVPARSLDPLSTTLQPAGKDSKALVVSGNGFPSDSVFGGDVFSATQPKQVASSLNISAIILPNSSNNAFGTTGSQLSVKPAQVNSLSSLVSGTPVQQVQSLGKQNHLDAIPSNAAISGAVGSSGSNLAESQVQWPKMTQANIQKYTKVFVEVDKDRDGRITGEEARNLFLSWRLPREVLKQVWDLSDQDGDSMLSLREFCIALYLMERYREGRPLPAMLPNSLKFDDALLRATSQPSVAYGGHAWQPSPGFSQPARPGSHPVMPNTALGPHPDVQISPHIDSRMQPRQQRSTAPVLDKQFVNQLSNKEQNALNSKLIEATDSDKKVQELENEIMDFKEKMEFYRTKMQELVLYKSRCDNKLNEITEKASADKREVEMLAKKYEEKYKQVGEVSSKLTVEEATFRDVQERKLELYNAIVKMEQGGSADGLLQVRADRIQSNLEELVKGLNDRCKKYGLNVKPAALIELPFGWQPGIPEAAADWDEDWDKFEDDGFMLVKELTADVDNVIAPPKSKSSFDKAPKDDTSPSPSSDVEKKVDTTGDRDTKSEVAYTQSEDASVRSLPRSPSERSALESPSKDFHSTQFGMHDTLFHVNDNLSDHGAAESTVSGDKYADESSWGATFDTNDDADSIWGFDPTNKEPGHERNQQNSFDSGDFGLNPIRTGSTSADNMFGKDKSSLFADSVPATPLFSSGPSPRYNEGSEHSFDSFSRFDSFGTQGNLARFDSMFSSKDFDPSGLFSQPESLARFDSIRSTRETDQSRGFTSFDDADPFGTGPFKSSESNTPRRGSDNWSAF